MTPIFMWAGGKTKMIKKYAQEGLLPPLGSFDTFVEPFFGGGAMTIYVYENYPQVNNYSINDINGEIIQLYRVIKEDISNFLTALDKLQTEYLQLQTHQGRKDFFYSLRLRYTEHFKELSLTEESALLYFLMRTAFNGLWQTTIKAKGRFATPAGLLNHKTHVYDRGNLLLWSDFLNTKNVTITADSWQKVAKEDNTGRTFFFFDPPYRDSFTQYATDFDDTAHIELIKFAAHQTKNGNSVFVCNRDSGDTFFNDNRDNLSIHYFDTTYTAGRRSTDTTGKKQAKKVTEVLLTN